MSNSKKILVTGANGATGRRTAEILAEKGASVRALVRTLDGRSEKLRAIGAEVVVGDLLDLDDANRVLQDVSAAYLVYPIAPGLITATSFFAQAAKERGVSHVVNMSQISARREAKSHAARNHWIAERILDWSGIPVTHLRPTFFAEWLTYPLTLPDIVERNALTVPFGSGRHAPIAAADQSRLIAAILLEPQPHASKVYPLCGPVELSYDEIAEIVSDKLGRTIRYEPMSIDAYRKKLGDNPHVNDLLAQHLPEVALDYQAGVFAGTDQIIERVTGAPPMTVGDFVESRREAFAAGA